MGSRWSQEFIKKPHFKNGSTKISVLEVRIDSMQHFFPFFSFWYTLILVAWDGADAFKLIFKVQVLNGISIQWFCLYTLLWCYRAKDLSHVGEIRGPSICHLTALTERKPHLDFWCMLSPSVSLLLCGSKTSVGVWNKNRLSVMNLIYMLQGKLL